DKTITVTDDKVTHSAHPVTLGTADWNADGTATSFDYALNLPGTAGKCQSYVNHAAIVETGQKAQATVRVCGPDVKPRQVQRTPPTVRPDDGVLPNTGGPSGWYVGGGSALVLLGLGLFLAEGARRRRSS
ncbi:MAG: hypothetical protein ACRDPI_01560, partial [Nocardioidaceae bacterium]